MRRLAVTLFLLAGLVPALCAQGSASIQAIADLDVTAVSVFSNANLAFGAVTPGVATTIDPQTSGNAGVFEIHGARRAEIVISLTLPTQLVVGPNNMPISFGGTSACHRNRDQQGNCTYYDPSTPLTVKIRANPFPNNTYFVWLGATVNPSAVQFPGNYQANITLTAAYTGN